MAFTIGEYFKWEDTGKNLTRELVNFKFRVHELIPVQQREQVFTLLDAAVNLALVSALNFEQLEEYRKMSELYSEFSEESERK